MTALAAISTVGAVVGQVFGPVSWAQLQPAVSLWQQSGTILPDYFSIQNESQCGFLVTRIGTGKTFRIAAGGWLSPTSATTAIGQDTGLLFTVEYVLTNPVVQQIGVDYFSPGEPLPQIRTLGNSPIGGNVRVSNSPVIVLEPTTPALGITVTTAVTVATYTTASQGLYQVIGSFLVNNGGASSVTVQATFTSSFNSGVNTRTLANNTGGTLSAAGLSNGTYGIACPTFYCQGGTNITITYQNALNTPNDDAVFGVIQVF